MVNNANLAKALRPPGTRVAMHWPLNKEPYVLALRRPQRTPWVINLLLSPSLRASASDKNVVPSMSGGGRIPSVYSMW